MTDTLPAGPFRSVDIGGGRAAPWYILPFDKKGRTSGPKTWEALVADAQHSAYTDVFVFSHGWNNDWSTASNRYEEFIGGYIRMRAREGLLNEEEYRPLLIGIIWPSTALVLPWERAPEFAGSTSARPNTAPLEDVPRMIGELAEDVDPANREEFVRLATLPLLSGAEARRLAEILTPAIASYRAEDVKEDDSVASPDELLQLWRRVPGEPSSGSRLGEFGLPSDLPVTGPAAAGWDALDPRKVLRVVTVQQMKDRAGVVGRDGVGPLLHALTVAAPGARVHLLGHSYGAIVVLSALCADINTDTRVSSVLLLQPAVSQWCFADNVAGHGFSGGYRPALNRVRGRIFTTFSKHDSALRKMFHLAVRRKRDLGQPHAASGLPAPPSEYAALGGYGPAGLTPEEMAVVQMTDPPSPYLATPRTAKVWALNGDTHIGGHGEISNPATWWALYQQVRSPET